MEIKIPLQLKKVYPSAETNKPKANNYIGTEQYGYLLETKKNNTKDLNNLFFNNKKLIKQETNTLSLITPKENNETYDNLKSGELLSTDFTKLDSIEKILVLLVLELKFNNNINEESVKEKWKILQGKNKKNIEKVNMPLYFCNTKILAINNIGEVIPMTLIENIINATYLGKTTMPLAKEQKEENIILQSQRQKYKNSIKIINNLIQFINYKVKLNIEMLKFFFLIRRFKYITLNNFNLFIPLNNFYNLYLQKIIQEFEYINYNFFNKIKLLNKSQNFPNTINSHKYTDIKNDFNLNLKELNENLIKSQENKININLKLFYKLVFNGFLYPLDKVFFKKGQRLKIINNNFFSSNLNNPIARGISKFGFYNFLNQINHFDLKKKGHNNKDYIFYGYYFNNDLNPLNIKYFNNSIVSNFNLNNTDFNFFNEKKVLNKTTGNITNSITSQEISKYNSIDLKNNEVSMLPNTLILPNTKAENKNKTGEFIIKDSILKFLNKKYKANKDGWFLIEDIQILLTYFFKSTYSLISKPKFVFTADKIKIELFYYLTIPDLNIFKLYNILYSNNIYALGTENNKVKSVINNNIIKGNKYKKIKEQNSNYIKKKIKNILNKENLVKKTLFNLNNNNISKVYFFKFKILCLFLNYYFKKPVEFDLIRLHQAEYDSNILVYFFSLIIKKKNIKLAIDKIFSKNSIKNINDIKINNSLPQASFLNLGQNIPAFISGVKVKIGGRLMREPIIPRLTTKNYEKGIYAKGKINLLNVAILNRKNKKGAFTIKIIFAQNSY